ncbi:MAG TPA: thioredoxin domain-containing protein [Pyrinomonadaceae bacterium]|nr:thioredoxin domain-containing protein [Pyrinomonadaceae bacterium]
MNRTTLLIISITLIVFAAATLAQTPRRRTGPAPKPKPTPSPTPVPVSNQLQQPAEPAPATLAIVNDTSITQSDVGDQINAAILNDPDLYLRAFYLDPEKEIKEARQRALDARINSLLIAAEAKKRGKSPDEIVEKEINAKISPPTEQEIQAAYAANRDQLGSVDLEKVRPDLINYLRNQRKQELYEAYLNRLRMTNAVAKRADVNAPNLAPGTVLAAVNGDPIRVDMIDERMKAYAYKLQMRIYAAEKSAVDRRINDLLLIAEANKRKIGPEEIVRAEVTDKLKPPTEADVANFYNENKARITGDLASARASIANYLQQQQQEKLETALSERLRAGAKVQMLLKEPVPPVLNVSAGNGPARGDANSAVTIIEFTDFQCSACGAMYPIVEDVLKSYGNRVRFVIRDFPLTTLHPNAFRAAQAASAANAQGKFWEYIDILFKNQSTLDGDSLKKYATQIGLDRKRFDAEFESGKYDADIRRDIEDGETCGVEGTPTIFINGVMLTDLRADGLRAAIEKAFKTGQKRG